MASWRKVLFIPVARSTLEDSLTLQFWQFVNQRFGTFSLFDYGGTKVYIAVLAIRESEIRDILVI